MDDIRIFAPRGATLIESEEVKEIRTRDEVASEITWMVAKEGQEAEENQSAYPPPQRTV